MKGMTDIKRWIHQGGGISMKKMGLVAATAALILLVNVNLTYAQSVDYKAYELLNMLEYLYPQYLSPAPQITRMDQDGSFYRSYGSGITIRTKNGHLYINSEDVCMINDFCFPYAQAEILFNWLETNFPEFLAPVPQATQVQDAIFYRAYPETNTMIGTFDKDLYFLDDQSVPHNLGRAGYWLREVPDFKEFLAKEVLDGVYTIQQVSTKDQDLYVDAYDKPSCVNDYRLALRKDEDNDSQRWIVKPVGNNEYTIQQKSTDDRYVDAYETGGTKGHFCGLIYIYDDYALATRNEENNDSQRWIIEPVGINGKIIEYTIRQKSTDDRYVDAYQDGGGDYRLVTRPKEDNNTQKWIFTLVPGYMNLLGVYYNLDDAEIGPIDFKDLGSLINLNCTSITQSKTFSQAFEIEEKSSFTQSVGFEVAIGTTFSVGMPGLTAGGNISISTYADWTSGKETTIKKTYTVESPVIAPPYSCVIGNAVAFKKTVEKVPYIMLFESQVTGAIHVSGGTWKGDPSYDYHVSTTEVQDLCECAVSQQDKESCGCQ